MKRAELILGIMLLLFAVFMGYESSLVESGADKGMGAGFMPFWLSVGLGITSFILLVRAVVLPAKNFGLSFFLEKTGGKRVVLILAGYLVAVVVMKPLGIMISLAILMAVTMPLFGSRNWKAILLASLLTPIVVFLVFGLLLKIDLPMGIFENILSIY